MTTDFLGAWADVLFVSDAMTAQVYKRSWRVRPDTFKEVAIFNSKRWAAGGEGNKYRPVASHRSGRKYDGIFTVDR